MIISLHDAAAAHLQFSIHHSCLTVRKELSYRTFSDIPAQRRADHRGTFCHTVSLQNGNVIFCKQIQKLRLQIGTTTADRVELFSKYCFFHHFRIFISCCSQLFRQGFNHHGHHEHDVWPKQFDIGRHPEQGIINTDHRSA